MAVYRSDQAQLTFAVEAAPGGYPEVASSVTDGTGTAVINLAAGIPAGSRTLTVDALSGITAGEFIQIGPEVGGSGTSEESEVRKVEFVDGTTGLVLDAPTGFFHADNTNIQVVTAVADTDADKLITFVPGIYESVDVPDPEQAIEPRYFLGTASKRNFFAAYKGQQTFSGSLGGFVLLDGRALRFPIGKVTTMPVESDGATQAIEGTAITLSAGTSSGAKKGDMYITVSASHGLVANDYILIYGAASTSSTDSLGTTGTSGTEVRKVAAVPSTNVMKLDAPLQFDHPTGAFIREVDASSLSRYKHTILETVDLDSVSWHVHMRDSGETAANDFDRRYYGGKIGSMSLAAEEGGLLTCSWDGINFLGMVHNQQKEGDITVGNGLHIADQMPFYSLMKTIDSGDIQFPSNEPYYFSQGRVTLFGTEIARVRSFSLSINNNEEPRYYLTRQMGRHRGPTEIREQRREYSCTVSLALPDSAAASSTATTVFKELLLEGDYGAGMRGFDIELRFDRGTNDSILINIPDNTTSAAATGGNAQGAFIRTAPHNITDANPLEVEADILFRNLKITIEDSNPVYI